MRSQDWTLIRKVAATTTFALLGMVQSDCVQTGFAQESQVTTPVQQNNTVKARIRLRTEDQQSPSDAGQYDSTSVPGIKEGAATPQRASLLDPRFSGFPKSNASQLIATQTEAPATPVAPVSWQVPETNQTPSLPLPTQELQQPPASPQVQGQEGIQIDPDNPRFQGLQGSVKIVVTDNKLTFIGDPADIAIVERQLEEIRANTEEELRLPERISLRFSDSEEIAERIRGIYDENFEQKVGKAEIVPLPTQNALLVFGSQPAIDAVKGIVEKIESDVSPEAAKDFESFALEHISAVDAKRRLDEFFGGGDNAAAFPIGAWTVVADYRSNVVVVRGNAQVLQQAKLLLAAIDIDEETLATKRVQVFQLQNASANDLAVILLDAINGALRNTTAPLQGGGQAGGLTPAPAGQGADEFSSEATPSRLQLQTVGEDGEPITSGLLFNVRITPDTASNSLIVRAPASAMPLIAELINQLDRLPNAESLIKVFQIVNGDAQELLTMLESIFGADQAGQAGQAGQTGGLATLPLQTTSASPGSALVNLRFAIDLRTNSIIATGPAGDLQVVEDLLNRLDEDLRSRRETVVYRLSNSNVLDVEESLNTLLDSRAEVLASDPRAAGAVLSDQEVVIVPEVGSNSLIISAVPENFPEIERIIRRLDRRPPMVKVKVMMAEVNLGSFEEFGVELGVQDSLLFDRSTTVGPGGAITGTGFDFNGSPTANLNATFPGTLAGRALSTLGVGTSNPALGFGGLVLSAGNESVNVLLRSLKDRGCLRVLSRPHIMTLENLQGRVSIGQIVPRITGTNTNQFGNINNVIDEREVGVILEITPRVSPDGMITMFVNIVRSSLGQAADGVPVAVDPQGNVILQAPIDSTEAQTTLISRSGQTIVFSGLIQETKEHSERGTPILSDLPVIGPLFKFESDQASRQELLIFLTPTLVDTDGAVAMENQDEMERMHWCLCDVAEVYGNTDFDPVHADMDATRTIYPGEQPGDVYYSSENATGEQQIDRVAQTVDQPNAVKQVGFLNKMKLSLKKSPVGKIADHIRGTNPRNRNDRNRRDFEELKRLRSQRQE